MKKISTIEAIQGYINAQGASSAPAIINAYLQSGRIDEDIALYLNLIWAEWGE